MTFKWNSDGSRGCNWNSPRGAGIIKVNRIGHSGFEYDRKMLRQIQSFYALSWHIIHRRKFVFQSVLYYLYGRDDVLLKWSIWKIKYFDIILNYLQKSCIQLSIHVCSSIFYRLIGKMHHVTSIPIKMVTYICWLYDWNSPGNHVKVFFIRKRVFNVNRLSLLWSYTHYRSGNLHV